LPSGSGTVPVYRQIAEQPAHLVFRLNHVADFPDRGITRPQFGIAIEQIPLLLHRGLAGVDEFRQTIVPLLEHHVDVLPGILHVFAEHDKGVVDADGK
jgi:hypothetical protein